MNYRNKSLTRTNRLLILFLLAGTLALTGCGRSPEQLAADEAQAEKWRRADELAKKWQEEGALALEATDNAIRSESSDRRSRLEKASKSVKTTNSNGVRVDQYILKKGGLISCTTTISGSSPAVFNCDGDV